ncbi:aminoglycoside phosphotransferase family protein [Kitasatospora sp. NPDC094011]|uniref:aminoglycoside phosphotransferase family protein n=1 Tax=Kitasatospora sp. NPDC094011 TaxID=3364090 RepID=UPI0038174FAB
MTRFADGSSVFVKMATDERTADWLRNEHRALRLVGGRIGPEVLRWEDGDRPLLIATDLSDAYWPAATGETRWRPGDIDRLLAALDGLRSIEPSGDMGSVADWPDAAWGRLVGSSVLVRAGLCSSMWLDRAGPVIAAVDERAQPGGECLVHGDVRSDNLCVLRDGQVRLVDWSASGIGHAAHDLALLLPTVRLEGGPRPATVLSEPVELIARLCGATVGRAVSRRPMPDWLRRVFLRLAAIDLQWLADVLALEPPDGPMVNQLLDEASASDPSG